MGSSHGYGPSYIPLTVWSGSTWYPKNRQVVNSLGDIYVASVAHLSAAATEPGVGVNWATVWIGPVVLGMKSDQQAALDAATTLDATHPPLVKDTATTADLPDSLGRRYATENVSLAIEAMIEPAAANPAVTHDDIFHSTHYAASGSFSAPTIVVPADRRSLVVPTDGGLKIGGSFYRWSGIPNIDVDVAANWDDSQYATALARRGMNLYLYECQHAGQLAPDFVLSANATFPTGYNANNSRKIAWFHTLPISLGTIAGHPLSGYLAGDVSRRSIADLLNRPTCSPEGMVQSILLPEWWVDAWLQTGTGATTALAFNATITDTRDWLSFVDDLVAVGKVLLTDALFQIFAIGSPEEVNIYGGQDPVKTGLIGTKAFTGAGLNDLTLDRTAWSHAAFAQEYEVKIDSVGTPDTFKHRKRNLAGSWGSYTTGVPIVAGAIAIADGLTVAFGATTGHTIDNAWNINLMDAPFSTAGVPMISHDGAWAMTGNMWQWLQDQSYRFDGAANHTHQVTVSGDPQTVTSGNPSGDVAPAWGYYDLPGAKGSLYRQGTFGDVKLVAGGFWSYGSDCGSRSRPAYYSRWSTGSDIGARGCARSRVVGV